MKARLAIPLCILLAAAPAAGDAARGVKIEKVEFLDARHSEKAKTATLVEGEYLALRVTVSGLQEKDGNLNCVLDLVLKDEAGTVKLQKEKVSGGDFKNSLGRPTASFFIEINSLTGIVGKFRLAVKARDLNAGAADFWESDLSLEPARLGVYNPRFLASGGRDEKPTELPRLLPVGGQVDLAFRILGLTSEGARIHIAIQVDVFDAKTDEKLYTTQGKPLTGLEYAGRGPEDGIIGMTHTLTLTRTGRFYVRVTAEDKLARKKAERDIRFRVMSPEDFDRDF